MVTSQGSDTRPVEVSVEVVALRICTDFFILTLPLPLAADSVEVAAGWVGGNKFSFSAGVVVGSRSNRALFLIMTVGLDSTVASTASGSAMVVLLADELIRIPLLFEMVEMGC